MHNIASRYRFLGLVPIYVFHACSHWLAILCNTQVNWFSIVNGDALVACVPQASWCITPIVSSQSVGHVNAPVPLSSPLAPYVVPNVDTPKSPWTPFEGERRVHISLIGLIITFILSIQVELPTISTAELSGSTSKGLQMVSVLSQTSFGCTCWWLM